MRHNLIYFVFCFLLSVAACKHEIPVKPGTPGNNNTNTGGTGGNNQKPCNADSVYFERDIMPLLSSNCNMSGCHGNGSAQDGVDLSNYERIMATANVRAGDPNGSDLYEVLVEDDEDKRMPYMKPALPAEDIFLIRKWIQQGAKNNNCMSCDTGQVTFSKSIMPVLTKNCVGCHNDNLASGSVKLNSHADVKVVAQNGRLLGSISHAAGFKPMPQGGNKLPNCTINQIKTWISAGAPNN